MLGGFRIRSVPGVPESLPVMELGRRVVVRCGRVTNWQNGDPMFDWLTRLLNSANGTKKQLGNRGEIEAAEYLQRLGYTILHRQHRSRFGELDLVARDGQTLVFVEVKTRTTSAAGHPAESITPAKQAQLTRAAVAFLKKRRWLQQRARFDVVAIIWPVANQPPQIQHYQNAFEPTGFGQMFS